MKNKDGILPLQWYKGIGPRKAEALAKEGITKPVDLIYYFPRGYIDRSAVASLKSLAVKLRSDSFIDKAGSEKPALYNEVIVVGRIDGKKQINFGRGRKALKVNITDSSGGKAELIYWSYAEYYNRILKNGELVTVNGKAELNKYNTVSFNHPEVEKFNDDDEKLYQEGKIIPVYPLKQGMKSANINMRSLRNIISSVLEKELKNISETLPVELLAKYKFPDKKTSAKALHYPESRRIAERASKRMKYEEIFYFELYLAARQKLSHSKETGPPVNPKSRLARTLLDSLPFELTDAQKRAIREIMADMEGGPPMNRLLQGDVGSGKTIVALLCMLSVINDGYQAAIMAPTEILAEQHYHSVTNYFEKLGVKAVQLLGGQKKKIREKVKNMIESGEAGIIVGTHAMFQGEIRYNKLGLIVVDEQHRFGVQQRAELKKMGSESMAESSYTPHILVMSATPIPRTLSMTVYGDLDVSIIKEMPKNRKPVKTKVVFESQLPAVYDFIKDEVKKGGQAYIVYPLVEKSEKMELKAAEDSFAILSEHIFPDFNIGLLHGQMFWYEKEEAMRDFLDKKYDILISTTVIEVGIDIPNATVMLIENAERFGLAQLHQLRGRVGRGENQSYCILATKDNYKYEFKKRPGQEDDRKSAIIRLKTMERTTDGFEISRVDMELRGPGDFLGTKQSGLPNFKFIDLINDGPIIEYARKDAFRILKEDRRLAKPENAPVRREYIRLFKEKENYYDIA